MAAAIAWHAAPAGSTEREASDVRPQRRMAAATAWHAAYAGFTEREAGWMRPQKDQLPQQHGTRRCWFTYRVAVVV